MRDYLSLIFICGIMDLISEFYDGYRYFGYWSSPQRFGNQIRVHSREDVIELLNKYNGVYNCGISMCSIIGEVPLMLYLPFDFDSYNLKESWEDAKKLYNYLAPDYDISINYSGYRGFHCFLTIPPKMYSTNLIKTAQKWFMDALDLKTCDPNIFGDWRRLMRIPGTLHCGKFKKDKEKQWKRLGEGNYCQQIKYSKGDMFPLDELFEDDNPEYEFVNINGSRDGKKPHPYPCLEHTLKYYRDEYNEREPPQLIRYSYVAYLLKLGKEPEEIFDMLYDKYSTGKEYEWYDWNDTTTMTQINQIARNERYNPLKCKTIESMGFCLKENCPYYTKDWKVKKLRNLK
jgi:hypothetical protein